MNGKTNINESLNPCSAAKDRNTYGWKKLNVCFWGRRLVCFTVGRLTVDIFAGWLEKPFIYRGGGDATCPHYWRLYWPFGNILWVESEK